MNKKKRKNAPTRGNRLLFFVAIALVAATIAALLPKRKEVKQAEKKSALTTEQTAGGPAYVVSNDVLERHLKLISEISPTNVCPGITPVHIFAETDGVKRLVATGGQMPDGAIITCAHMFWNTQRKPKKAARYYYRTLQPHSEAFQPIAKAGQIDIQGETNDSKDIALCIPGPSTLIEPFTPDSKEVIVSDGKPLTDFTYTPIAPGPQPLRSTVTGKEARLFGRMSMPGTPTYYIVEYDGHPTQSGTILVNPQNDMLFIVGGDTTFDEQMFRQLGIRETVLKLAFCSSVSVKWNYTTAEQ